MFSSLKGQLLVATPDMSDARFFESIIYLVKHNEDGAMGLVINHKLEGLQFNDILTQMNLGKAEEIINLPAQVQNREIYRGGPVEQGRGFVLHSNDYLSENSSFRVNDEISLTASIDILRVMAFGKSPQNSLIALGYCGWQPGQLEHELKQNGWLTTQNNSEILFNTPTKDRYNKVLEQIGVTRASLSPISGNA